MKICAFIGDMYRDFALSIIRHLDYYAQEKGHRIDVFGMCSVTTSNPLHVNGLKSILTLPNVHDYDGIILCYDTLIHEDLGKDLVEDLLDDMEAPSPKIYEGDTDELPISVHSVSMEEANVLGL